MKNALKYDLCLKPTSFERISDQFTKCKCYVMGLGKNRNLSYISKKAVDDALYSLGYSPVVAHLMYDKDNNVWYVGGHDRKIDENYNFVDMTVPYGVVVTDTYNYEDVVESSGSVVTYLTCEVILWTGRYADLMNAAYNEDIYFGQSMEINPIEACPYKKDERYVDIKKFVFSCLTLLGKSDDKEYHVEPCFPESKVVPFSADDQFASLYKEMRDQIADINENYKMLVEKFSCLEQKEERNLDGNVIIDISKSDVASTSTSDVAYATTVGGLAASNSQAVTAIVPESEHIADSEPEAKFELNLLEYLKEIEAQVSQEKIKDEEWGWEYSRYWLVDVQDDEVIVSDLADNWNYYGFELVKDGDSVTVDFKKKKRKKCKFENFESSEQLIAFKVADSFAEMTESYASVAKSLKEDLAKFENDLASAREQSEQDAEKFSALMQQLDEYKQKVEEAEAKAAKDARDQVFEKFDNELEGMEEYASLKSSELDATEIEKECFALIGKKKFVPIQNNTRTDSAARFSFASSGSSENKPYNGLMEKYRK